MTKIQTIPLLGVPDPGGHYSHAVLCNGLLFTSGQLPHLPDGSRASDADFDTQCERALTNVFRILEAHGQGRNQILKVTAYIVGVERWPSFNQVYARMFGPHRPARTVVPVPELHYGYLVEIDAIAAMSA